MGLRAAVYSVYERRLRASLSGLPTPRHVAIMIDGNRRWARASGFEDVSQGHVAGARHIANLLSWCREAGVDHVTIWMLSTDNLSRPPEELEPLLRIIAGVADELSAPGQPWRVQAMGALDLLPDDTAAALKTAQERTAERDGLIDVDHIAEHLYTRGQPDPDLVIRTSGEQRLSGFLLWQSAHSEFYFCDALWPDFRKIDFLRALRDYGARQRRYGK